MKYLLNYTFKLFFLFCTFSSNGQAPILVPATESYLGVFGSANLSIRYASGSTMNRPLIVFEGFDPGHITSPEKQFGESTIEQFLFDIDKLIKTNPLANLK
jgi:hypothetical protein